MASYHPPSEVLSIFNDLNYQIAYGSISFADASATFLKLTGGSVSGMLYANGGLSATSIYSSGVVDVGTLKIAGSTVNLSAIAGVTPGTAEASKALIVNADKDISSIRYLSATRLTGTIALTASTATVGSNSISDILFYTNGTRGLYLRETTANTSWGLGWSAAGTGYLDIISISYALNNSSIDINSSIKNVIAAGAKVTANLINSTAGYQIGGVSCIDSTGTLQTAAQTNITSVGTLSALSVSGVLTLSGTAVTSSATELNILDGVTATTTKINYIDTTAGTAEANKALVFDTNKDITGIRYLTATQLTGTLQTAAQGNITSIGILTGLTVNANVRIGGTSSPDFKLHITTSASDRVLCLYNTSLPTAYYGFGCNGNALMYHSDLYHRWYIGSKGDSTSTVTMTLSGTSLTIPGLTMGAVTLSETEVGYIDGITAGSATASKALILDANKDITGIRYLTATQLTGTLQTSAQGNITSVGTLTSLAISRTANDSLTITNTSTTGLANMKFISDTGSWEVGARGSASSAPLNGYYVYGAGAMQLVINSSGNIGLGTASPGAYRCDINGACNATSYYQSGVLTDFSTLGSAGVFAASKSLVLDASGYLFTASGAVSALNANTGTVLSVGVSTWNKLFVNSESGLTYASYGSGKTGAFSIQTSYAGAAGSMQRWVVQESGSQKELSLDYNYSSYMYSFYSNSSSWGLNVTSGTDASAPGLYLAPNRAGVCVFTSSVVTGAALTVNGAISCASKTVSTGPSFYDYGGGVSYLNTSMSAGTATILRCGKSLATNNMFSLSFSYVSDGSADNALQCNPYGSSGALTVFADGTVSVNSTGHSYGRFHVNGYIGYYFASGSLYRQTWTTSSTYTDYGLAPYTANISISCTDYVISAGLLMRSDSRYKHDIHDYELDMDNFMKYRPVRFKWNDTDESSIGLIAQEVIRTQPEENVRDIVNFIEDPELTGDQIINDGIACNIDYSKIPVINMRAIQLVYKENMELRSIVEDLEDRLTDLERLVNKDKRNENSSQDTTKPYIVNRCVLKRRVN